MSDYKAKIDKVASELTAVAGERITVGYQQGYFNPDNGTYFCYGNRSALRRVWDVYVGSREFICDTSASGETYCKIPRSVIGNAIVACSDCPFCQIDDGVVCCTSGESFELGVNLSRRDKRCPMSGKTMSWPGDLSDDNR